MGITKAEDVKSITIVTAFFDIGRGDWSKDKGHPSFLQRKTETYLSYFENLGKLDNEMVIFTSADLAPLIKEIRGKKPTYVVNVDLERKFAKPLDQIGSVLSNKDFQNRIDDKHKQNPEYWSRKYVLITNLKTYFVNQAISNFKLKNELVAWVDFGYCRNESTLLGIKNWYYPFDFEHIHFFTLKKDKLFSIFKNPKFPHSKKQVLTAILNNRPYIIGGVTVAHINMWQRFNKVTRISTLFLNL